MVEASQPEIFKGNPGPDKEIPIDIIIPRIIASNEFGNVRKHLDEIGFTKRTIENKHPLTYGDLPEAHQKDEKSVMMDHFEEVVGNGSSVPKLSQPTFK